MGLLSEETYSSVAEAMPFGCARAQGQLKTFRGQQGPVEAWFYHKLQCNSKMIHGGKRGTGT